jgi:hypothetical protein
VHARTHQPPTPWLTAMICLDNYCSQFYHPFCETKNSVSIENDDDDKLLWKTQKDVTKPNEDGIMIMKIM